MPRRRSVRRPSGPRGPLLHQSCRGPFGVRVAIEALPWVDTVSVSRAWPRGLHVQVVEQVAAARWGDERPAQHARRAVRERCAPRAAGAARSFRGPEGTRKHGRAALSRLAGPPRGELACASPRCASMRAARGNSISRTASRVRLGRRQVDERFERFVTTAAQARRAARRRHRLRRHALHERFCGRLAQCRARGARRRGRQSDDG